MKYITYRHVEVPNILKIQKELSEFILPYCEGKITGLWSVDTKTFINLCPYTVIYFTDNNLLTSLKKVCYTVVHPGAKSTDAHVDRNIEPPASGGQTSGCLSLNFGIANCIETSVVFYKYISGPKKYVPLPDPVEGSYIFYAESELEEIDRYILDKPVIMNNTVPHGILNDTNEPRISISFRFLNDPWNLILTQTNQ